MATAKKISQEHDSLVKELIQVRERYLALLKSAKDNFITIEFRVLDAPNSQWMKIFPNHEWDLEGEVYRIPPFESLSDGE